MIQQSFLASLRHRQRAELVLLLVQLEQVCPGWWESLGDLAEQLGTDRQTLNRGLRKLERAGLIRRNSVCRSGTWIWWVKRHENDEPHPNDEPAWVLRMLTSSHTARVTLSNRRQWAKSRNIPFPTLLGFLYGRQTVLRGQWRVVASPFDVVDSEVAA